MTIYIPWWLAAFMPVCAGFGVAMLLPAPRDYDFMTPMLAIGAILIGIAGTVGILIGHFT